MTDPLSFLILSTGVAAMTGVGYNILKNQPVIVPITETPKGVTVGKQNSLFQTPFQFDDSSSSPQNLWSAAKISKLVKDRPGISVPKHVANNIVLFGLNDSGMRVDDSSDFNPTTLWSSAKIQNYTEKLKSGNVLLQPSNTNVAIFNKIGEPTGTKYKFSDTESGADVVWSSEKISSVLKNPTGMKRVKSAHDGNVATFNNSGQVVDSNNKIDASIDSAKTIYNAFGTKLATVFAPAKNFAFCEMNGDIKDGSSFVDDTKTGSNVLWSSQKIDSSINSSKSSALSNLSQIRFPVVPNIQPISVPSSQQKMLNVPQAIEGNITILNSSGQAFDSGKRLNDAGRQNIDIWSAAKIQTEIDDIGTFNYKSSVNSNVIKKMNTGPVSVKNFAACLSDGNVKDSGISLDDQALDASHVWSSAKTSELFNTMSSKILSEEQKIAALVAATTENSDKKMKTVPAAAKDSLCVFDSMGQISSESFPAESSVFRKELDKKLGGTGAPTTLAAWASNSSAKSSGVNVLDDAYRVDNVLTSNGIEDLGSRTLSPFLNTDSSKMYAFLKIENVTHPGPAFLPSGAGNYISVPVSWVEGNQSTNPNRLAYFRLSFFGAVTAPQSGYISLTFEGGKRQDTIVVANEIVPAYVTAVVKRTVPFIGMGFAVNPAPATIVFGYVSVVEL